MENLAPVLLWSDVSDKRASARNRMYFEVVGNIEQIETIAVGGRIKDIMKLRKQYGPGRWRKLKGIAKVKLRSGRLATAELHWYETHGIGKKKMKIKYILD